MAIASSIIIASSQTTLQRRARRTGNEQVIHQRLNVRNRHIRTLWIDSAGLVYICLSQTMEILFARQTANELRKDQQLDVTDSDLLRVRAQTIGITYPTLTASQRTKLLPETVTELSAGGEGFSHGGLCHSGVHAVMLRSRVYVAAGGDDLPADFLVGWQLV